MHIFYYLLVVTILTEAFTELGVKADIFYSFREYLSNKSSFLKDLLSCGYCFSVWVSLVLNTFLLGFFDIISITANSLNIKSYTYPQILIIFILYVILVHRLSNYLHGISDRFFSTSKDIRYKHED